MTPRTRPMPGSPISTRNSTDLGDGPGGSEARRLQVCGAGTRICQWLVSRLMVWISATGRSVVEVVVMGSRVPLVPSVAVQATS